MLTNHVIFNKPIPTSLIYMGCMNPKNRTLDAWDSFYPNSRWENFVFWSLNWVLYVDWGYCIILARGDLHQPTYWLYGTRSQLDWCRKWWLWTRGLMRSNWNKLHPPACTCAKCAPRRQGAPERKLSNRMKRKMRKNPNESRIHRRDCPCSQCSTVRRLLGDF